MSYHCGKIRYSQDIINKLIKLVKINLSLIQGNQKLSSCEVYWLFLMNTSIKLTKNFRDQ